MLLPRLPSEQSGEYNRASLHYWISLAKKQTRFSCSVRFSHTVTDTWLDCRLRINSKGDNNYVNTHLGSLHVPVSPVTTTTTLLSDLLRAEVSSRTRRRITYVTGQRSERSRTQQHGWRGEHWGRGLRENLQKRLVYKNIWRYNLWVKLSGCV